MKVSNNFQTKGTICIILVTSICLISGRNKNIQQASAQVNETYLAWPSLCTHFSNILRLDNNYVFSKEPIRNAQTKQTILSLKATTQLP